MIPVDQDMFYDPDAAPGEQRGNCWSACIASLLELPLHDVPNFVQVHVDGGENWWAHTIRFLDDRGYGLWSAEPDEDDYVIATGVSPRGNGNVHHAVINRGGTMVHDPHPSRAGLITQGSCYKLVAL